MCLDVSQIVCEGYCRYTLLSNTFTLTCRTMQNMLYVFFSITLLSFIPFPSTVYNVEYFHISVNASFMNTMIFQVISLADVELVESSSPLLLRCSVIRLSCWQDVWCLEPTVVIVQYIHTLSFLCHSFHNSYSISDFLTTWELVSPNDLLMRGLWELFTCCDLNTNWHRKLCKLNGPQCTSKARGYDNQYLNINHTVSTLGSEWTLIYIQSHECSELCITV